MPLIGFCDNYGAFAGALITAKRTRWPSICDVLRAHLRRRGQCQNSASQRADGKNGSRHRNFIRRARRGQIPLSRLESSVYPLLMGGRRKRVRLSDIKNKLQAELDGLESELRVHLPKEIKRALEFGDLRENSEYRAALDRQNMVKARIVELRQRISEIASIDINRVPRDKAS